MTTVSLLEGLWTVGDIPVYVVSQCLHYLSNTWCFEAWGKFSDELRIFTSVFIFGLISASLAPQEDLVPPFTHSSGNWLSECHLVLNDHVITFVNVILQDIILIIAHNPFQLHSEK